MPKMPNAVRAACLISLAVTGGTSAAVAQGGSPVALVEEISGGPSGISEMDYLTAGRTIRLAPNGRIVLSYLNSCQRETITGGTVVVGTERSDVQAGQVRRDTINCKPGSLRLTPQQAARAGVMVFRDKGTPVTEIHARAPVLEGIAPGRISIEPLEPAGPPVDVTIPATAVNKRKADLARLGVRLDPGKVYMLKAGEHRAYFKVAPGARDDSGPVLGRLVRLKN